MNRIIRQNLNNKYVYNCIINNNKLNNINDNALIRLLNYTNYNNIYELLKDKKNYYLIKKENNKNIIYTTQYAFKLYLNNNHKLNTLRIPVEAYIYETNNKIISIKILEKKEQKVVGSIDTKLWSGPSLKREYEIFYKNNNIIIEYAFCVNKFIQNKFNSNDNMKYKILNTICNENKIKIFYGEDNNYIDNIISWINLT